MDNYQPNTDTSHDHTYPEQPEGLRRFEALISNDVDVTPWPARAERRMAALEANAAEQARLIEELRRFCTDLVIRVAVLEQAVTSPGKTATAAELMARHSGEQCTWFRDDVNGTWISNCGMEFMLNDGGPTENGMRNCPRCGLPLVERTE